MPAAEASGDARPAGASVGELLRGWRERAMLTQEQLAEQAGLHVRTIRRLEAHATARPHSSTQRLLVAALRLGRAEQTTLRVAAQGTTGDPAAEPAAVQPAAPPRQLPAPPPAFTGRASELADLADPADANTVVITAIDGMAGVGKTALAVHAAHRIADRHPDGQLFVDLHGYTEGMQPVHPHDALDRVLQALGVPAERIPEDIDDRAALYRSHLAGRKVLILLDNAATEEQVTPLLPGTAGCRVLITSRRRLSGLDQARSVSLDVLPLEDATTLLARVAGDRQIGGQPPDLLIEAVKLCGQLPLAIRIAGVRLASRPAWTLAHLVERLRIPEHRLSAFGAERRSVATALELSYRRLTPDQRRAYRLGALHPGTDMDVHAFAAAIGTRLAEGARLADQLIDVHLLQESTAGRYSFHHLVRAHALAAGDRDDTPQERLAALRRLIGCYARMASAAMDVSYPAERERQPPVVYPAAPGPSLANQKAATAWLDIEMPNLLAVARYAADHRRPAYTVQLSAIVQRHLNIRGRYYNADQLHDLAMAITRGTGDRGAELDALIGPGALRRMQGRCDDASVHLTRALEIAHATSYRIGEVSAPTALSGIHRRQGRNEHAERSLIQDRVITTATGDQLGELSAMIGFGHVH